MEELILHLGEEGPLNNPAKDQTHEVGKTPDQPSSANELAEVGTSLVIQPSNDEPHNTSATDMLPQLCTLLTNQMQQQLQFQQEQNERHQQ